MGKSIGRNCQKDVSGSWCLSSLTFEDIYIQIKEIKHQHLPSKYIPSRIYLEGR